MTRIFKYTLAGNTGKQSMPVPLGATFLSVQLQQHRTVMWFAVDPADAACGRTFQLIQTGDEVPDGLEYLGTLQYHEGQYVLHLFEDLNN